MSFKIESSTSNSLSVQAVQDARFSRAQSNNGDLLASLSQEYRVIDGVYHTTMDTLATSKDSEVKQRLELEIREMGQQLREVEQHIGEVLRRSIDSSR